MVPIVDNSALRFQKYVIGSFKTQRTFVFFLTKIYYLYKNESLHALRQPKYFPYPNFKHRFKLRVCFTRTHTRVIIYRSIISKLLFRRVDHLSRLDILKSYKRHVEFQSVQIPIDGSYPRQSPIMRSRHLNFSAFCN